MVGSKKAPTFVLVHGAWADGTSWHKVIDALEAGGANAIAAPIPLTSVSDDIPAFDRCLASIEGPVVLAEQDRMINPETQEFMAQRMRATLRRLDVDHTPIATAPDRVVELLLQVGKSVSA